MKTIYKYPLSVRGIQSVSLPRYARPLCAQMQGNTLCMWAQVDTDQEKEPIGVAIVGTGHEMPEGEWNYLSTFQLEGGALIFHVFVAYSGVPASV